MKDYLITIKSECTIRKKTWILISKAIELILNNLVQYSARIFSTIRLFHLSIYIYQSAILTNKMRELHVVERTGEEKTAGQIFCNL